MSFLIPFALYGWVPFTLYLFTRLPPQRAVIFSFIGAVLFLPVTTLDVLHPIPALEKTSVACYGVLLATVIYDTNRFSSFKFSLIDLPMLIWCLCPIISQMTNELSPISPTLTQIVVWGGPYFIGRIYFNNLDRMRQLAIGIFVGGVIYIPFCQVENFMGPLMHQKLYGINAVDDWTQANRWGGWRPVVFMQHGLMVGFWMMAAALIGIALWKTGVLKKLWDKPIKWVVIVLLIQFFLCRSTGAYNLMVVGVAILFIAWRFRTALPLLLFIFYISSYLYSGASGTFSGTESVALIREVFGDDRADSIQFRYMNEEILGAKARQRIVFGWGGSGGNRVINEFTGQDVAITDSFWMIAFGVNGIVGLVSWAGSLLVPVMAFCLSRYSARSWSNPKVAPAAAMAVIIVLYIYDCLLNAMINPIYTLGAGGLAGLVTQAPETTKKVAKKAKGVRSSLPKRLAPQRQS